MRGGSIYVLTNKVNGNQYVGLTTKAVTHRWSEHKTSAVIGRKTRLFSALRKYGPDVFDVSEYFVVFDALHLSQIERQVIQDLKPAYNQTNGGEYTKGRKHTEETIERIRASNIGKKRTQAQKEEQRKLSKERWDASPEFRASCLAALEKGRQNKNEAKRIAAVKAANTGRKMSAESRAKMSASCMGRKYSAEIIAKMAATKRKPVKCNETGVIYSCREEAADKTGVSPRTIWRDCKEPSLKPGKRVTFSYI